jgi:hypothetical protein
MVSAVRRLRPLVAMEVPHTDGRGSDAKEGAAVVLVLTDARELTLPAYKQRRSHVLVHQSECESSGITDTAACASARQPTICIIYCRTASVLLAKLDGSSYPIAIPPKTMHSGSAAVAPTTRTTHTPS